MISKREHSDHCGSGHLDEARLTQRIKEVLAASPYAALRRLNYECVDSAIVLRGEVASFYLKQLAQTTVCRVQGVRELRNEIQVAKASPS